MRANPNMKARPSLLSKITDIGDEFPLFLVARTVKKFVLRIRRAALMLFFMTALAACDVPVLPLI